MVLTAYSVFIILTVQSWLLACLASVQQGVYRGLYTPCAQGRRRTPSDAVGCHRQAMVLTGYSVFVILALESWLAFYLASAHERRTRKLVSTLHHFPALTS